jgi:hypothetical protein
MAFQHCSEELFGLSPDLFPAERIGANLRCTVGRSLIDSKASL